MGHKRDYDTNSFDAEFRDIKINDPMEPFPERPTLLQGYELEEKCITYDNQPAHVQEGPVETPDLPPE